MLDFLVEMVIWILYSLVINYKYEKGISNFYSSKYVEQDY